MDLYFTRHDGRAATVEEFIQCFADATGTDLTQFMRWYTQAGTPEVTVIGTFDRERNTYRLDLSQTIPPTPGQPVKEPMVIPLLIGLIGPDGNELPLVRESGSVIENGLLVLTKRSDTVTFTGIRARPIPSLNRDFSAPIKLSTNLSEEDLCFLAAHDRDPLNRWQALQTLASRLLVENVSRVRAGRPLREDRALIAALAATLADERLDPAFVALALVPPSETDIAREIGQDIDPDAILAARRHLRASMGEELFASLAARYERLSTKEPYSPDAASAGRRALRNACLDLMAAGRPAAIALAMRQYQAADNMTDRVAALATLAQHECAERSAAFDDFYRRYEKDPLVIDKWLALQATIAEPGTLERVRTLTSHPSFSFANPNRVRALIGSFAHANQTQFNRLDGEGYAFVAETVLSLDGKNPQVAARLLSAFETWRSLEPVRRGRAEAVLRRIAAVEGLSRDVTDIVTRSLGETQA
jgi:aminopeptidase N